MTGINPAPTEAPAERRRHPLERQGVRRLNRLLLPRRAVLQGLGGLAIAAGSAGRAAAAPGAGTFLALGDWGRRGGRDQRDVAAAMGRAAAEAASRFVLSAGDNFYPMGVQTPDDDHW